MDRLRFVVLGTALLVAPAFVTAALAQSTAGSKVPSDSTGSTMQAPGTSSTAIIPPTKNGIGGMVRKVSPDSPGAQLANPAGAQPGTGSGMGKISGTAAGN